MSYQNVKHQVSEKNTQPCIDAFLIFPPFWDSFAPFLSIPYLAGFLKHKGFTVKSIDLNIMYFHSVVPEWKNYREKLLTCNITEANKIDNNFRNRFYSKVNIKKLEALYRKSEVKNIEELLTCLEYDSMNAVFTNSGINKYVQDGVRTIGFSCICLEQFAVSCLYAKNLKMLNAEVKIVFGGSFVTDIVHNTDLCGSEVFNYTDYLIYDEGETSLSLLMEHLKTGRGKIYDIPNLCYVDNGRIIKTNGTIENLDNLVLPDYSDYDLSDYLSPRPIIPYQSSRGCFWGNCAFCNHDSSYRHNFRSKLPEKMVAELTELKSIYGVSDFMFVDEAIRPDYLRALSKAMSDNPDFKDINWCAYLRINSQYTNELVTELYKNGCRMVFFGVETFSKRLSKFIKKGIDVEKIIPNIKLFSQGNIKVAIWMMVGLPSQTTEEVLYDIRQIEEISSWVDAVYLSLFHLFPQTDMFNQMENYNISDFDPDNYTVFKSYYDGKEIDQGEIFKIREEIYLPLVKKISSSFNRYLTYLYGIKQNEVFNILHSRKFVMYGAGNYAGCLLEVFAENGLPMPFEIWDIDAENKKALSGIPVIYPPVERIAIDYADVVIVVAILNKDVALDIKRQIEKYSHSVKVLIGRDTISIFGKQG